MTCASPGDSSSTQDELGKISVLLGIGDQARELRHVTHSDDAAQKDPAKSNLAQQRPIDMKIISQRDPGLCTNLLTQPACPLAEA